MVYYFTWEHDVPALPPRWEQLLSPERVHKAMQYKQEKDRRLCVWSFLLLRYALFEEYKTLTVPQWRYDENGKPYDAQSQYFFNISHCDCAVACAVDTHEVGVDVQDNRPISAAVIQKVCSESEIAALRNSNEPEKLFAAFWASKEAFGKQNGNGIGYDLKTQSFCMGEMFPCVVLIGDRILQTQLTECFALSFCAFGELETVAVSQLQIFAFLQKLIC